ncbi:glycoside hydrolase family 28 protein, partial [bacterium]
MPSTDNAIPVAALSTPSGFYNVRTFGARGDGKTLDTPAINQAIETAAAAGGGTVLLPAGTYLALSIHLKSNIRLHLDQGAVLQAAPR